MIGAEIMKYTSPIYVNEAVETTDILTSSKYKVQTVSKVVGKNEKGEDIIETATQITVNINNLF